MESSAAETTSPGLVALRARVEVLEAELRRRDTQLAEVEQIARVGSWEWDVAGDEVSWSPELYSIFGVDQNTFEPTYAGFMEAVHPDDRSRVEGALRAAMEGDGAYAAAHRIVRPEGGERLAICRAQVFRDAHGRPTRLVGAMVDLSEYRGVADGVRARQEQLNAAEELAGIASFEWHVRADRVVWSNGMYAIFGLERGEFGGTYSAYLDLIHPEDRIERRAAVDALVEAGDTLEGEQRIERPDGETRIIVSKLKAIRGDSGLLRSVIGVCRDVTDER